MTRLLACFVMLWTALATQAAEPFTTDSLALKILDSEALYTTTAGLKPLSDGFWQTRFPATQNTSPEVDAARAKLKELPLGPDLEAGVFVFATDFQGSKSASAFILHRPSFARLLARRGDVFTPLGIQPTTPGQEILEKIDRAPRAARWRAFGLAFGYPDYAVEFFVEAGEKQAETKKFVERDFLQLPTQASNEGRFVYAVPKGHEKRAEDFELFRETQDHFARYQAWRKVYIHELKRSPTELFKNWVTPPVVSNSFSNTSMPNNSILR
ncbi:MAG: hypothetical protein ACRC8S_18275 [Fimbriiglobus sp.]